MFQRTRESSFSGKSDDETHVLVRTYSFLELYYLSVNDYR